VPATFCVWIISTRDVASQRSNLLRPGAEDKILKAQGIHAQIQHLARGPLSFFNAFQIQEWVDKRIEEKPSLQFLIMEMSAVESIDVSGLHCLQEIWHKTHDNECVLVLVDLHAGTIHYYNSSLSGWFGRHHFQP
jgi:MFS superfamily sulfate permease-like transporter